MPLSKAAEPNWAERLFVGVFSVVKGAMRHRPSVGRPGVHRAMVLFVLNEEEIMKLYHFILIQNKEARSPLETTTWSRVELRWISSLTTTTLRLQSLYQTYNATPIKHGFLSGAVKRSEGGRRAGGAAAEPGGPGTAGY